MLPKNVKSTILVSLLLVIIFLVRNYSVQASPSSLRIMNILPESIDVNAGSSIVIPVLIYNNDSVSHNFTIYWITEGSATFSSRGIIMSNEMKSFTPSFTFSNYGAHEIMIQLFEDDISVETQTVIVNSQKFSVTIKYSFSPSPIYPGDNFSLSVSVINDGEKTVYNSVFRTFPTDLSEAETGINLMSGFVTLLNNLTEGQSQDLTLYFSTSPNTQPGVYSLRVSIDYYDYDYSFETYLKYQKSFTIPIVIYSNEILNDFDLLRHDFDVLEDRLQQLASLQLNMIYATVAVLAVSVLMAGINYYYTRRISEERRRKFKEKAR